MKYDVLILKCFENAFTGGSFESYTKLFYAFIISSFTQVSWYSGVHEVFTVFYIVDVFIIFQHIIQPLKIKKVVDA